MKVTRRKDGALKLKILCEPEITVWQYEPDGDVMMAIECGGERMAVKLTGLAAAILGNELVSRSNTIADDIRTELSGSRKAKP